MIPFQRFSFVLSIFALALAGCAGGGSEVAGRFGGAQARPKTILVSDFAVASDVDAIDRGFSARLDRKGTTYPILERKRRTLGRVNDEIVATVVADLREAGMNAQAGSEDGLSLGDEVLIVKGRLRPGSPMVPGEKRGKKARKSKAIGFGEGRGGVVADMTVSTFSSGGKRQLFAFSADGNIIGKPLAGRAAAARNAVIAEVLAAENAAPERLSPEVEAQARGLGRAVAEKIIAYVKTQGWLGAAVRAEGEAVRIPPVRRQPAPAKPET